MSTDSPAASRRRRSSPDTLASSRSGSEGPAPGTVVEVGSEPVGGRSRTGRTRTMCDACERTSPPAPAHADRSPHAPSVDRRTILRRAGIGGVAAVALATLLPEGLADAMAPPFESVQLGEDALQAYAPAVLPAARPAAGSKPSKQPSPPPGISAPAIVTRAEWGAD